MQARELNLLDMIVSILTHWRGLVVSMFIGAILFGIFSFTKSYRAEENEQSQNNIIINETTVQKQVEQLEESMNESERTAVMTTLDYEKEYDMKKTYSEHSIYMQLDPLHLVQTELVYSVQMLDENKAEQLGRIYELLLNNVGLYDWGEQQTGIEAGYVAELISTNMVSGAILQDEGPILTSGDDCLKVRILQGDIDSCQKLTDAVKSYISEQQKKITHEFGEHTLILVAETTGIVTNKNVMADQINWKNEIVSLQSTIVTAKADFTEKQNQYYKLLNWENFAQQEQDTQEINVEEKTYAPRVSKKYILLGALTLAIMYVGVLSMVYIFNTRVRISDEFQNIYHIPLLGQIVRESKKKFFLDKWIDTLHYYGKRRFTAEQSMELAFAAIKIALLKNGLSSVSLLGCNMGAGADEVCNSLKAALESEQISVTILNNILYNAETMEKLGTIQGAVLVEKAESTLYNEIFSELDLLKRQGIQVLGGIIVE